MRTLLLLCLLSVALSAGAQSLPDWAAPSPAPAMRSDEGPLETGPNPPPPPPPVPIDGGLTLLAAAGAGYAVRKLRRARARD